MKWIASEAVFMCERGALIDVSRAQGRGSSPEGVGVLHGDDT